MYTPHPTRSALTKTEQKGRSDDSLGFDDTRTSKMGQHQRGVQSAIVILFCWCLTVQFEPNHAQNCSCPVLKTIRFGQTAPFTGPNSALGTPIRDGILAAFNEYNQDAGDNKKFQLELVVKDDHYDAMTAMQNVELFAQDPTMFGIIGAAGTSSIEASAPIAIAHNMPLVGSYGGMILRQPFHRHVVSIRGSYVDEAAAIMMFLATESRERISLFAQNDALGENARNGLLSALDAYNLHLHSEGYYSKDANETTWAQESGDALLNMTNSSLSDSPPNAVVVAATTEPAAVFVRKLRTLWPDVAVICLSSVSIVLLINALAPTLNETFLLQNLYSSQFLPNPVTSSIPIVQQFRAACSRIGVSTPRYTALEGYLMARLAISVLERLKGDSVTQEAFLNSLYADSFFNLNGFRFGPYYPSDVDGGCNQGIHEVRIVQAQANKSLIDVYSTSYPTCGYKSKQWKTLTFGQSCTFSGSQASLCIDFREGLLASFKHTNDNGGIRGDTRFQLITKDDLNDPRVAVLNNHEFLEDPEVFGLIGTGIAGVGEVVSMVTKSDKVLFGPFNGARELREPFQRRIINYRASVDDEIAAIVHHCYYTKKLTRIAVLYEATGFGKYRRDQLQGSLREKRWSLQSEASFASNSSADISAAVTKLFSGDGFKLQAIVLFSLWDVVGDVMVSVHEHNPDVMIFGITKTVVGPSVLQMNESTRAKVNLNNFLQTVVVPNPFDTSIDVVVEYTKALAKSNPLAVVSAAGLEGFIVGQMLAVALTRVMGGELNVENLIETTFYNGYYNIFGLRCGPLSWITSNTSHLTSCNQCMKNVYLSSLTDQLQELFSFDATCMYVIPDNVDFELHSTRMIMVVIAGIGIGYCLIVMVLLLVYRANPHVSSVSMACAFITALGGLLCYGGIFVIYPVPTDLTCALQPWIADLAFVLLLGPNLTKLYRMDLVLTVRKSKKKKNFSDVQVFTTITVLVVGFVGFLVIYTIQDRPKMKEDFTDDGLRFETCVIKHSAFAYVDTSLKAMMLFWGCLLSQRIASIQGYGTRFQESKRLIVCMYHTGFLGLCLLLLGFTTNSHPTINFLCVSIILLLNTSFVVTVLCARPVVAAIRKESKEEIRIPKNLRMSSGIARASVRPSVTGSSAYSSAARLSRVSCNVPTAPAMGMVFHELPQIGSVRDGITESSP